MITDIKRKGQSEIYKVFVDGNFYALFEGEVIYKNYIKIGSDFDSDSLKKFKLESDNLLCSQMALTYVSRYLKTEKATRDYLKKYNFCDDAINSAIEKLKSYGYLNDEYFAKAYCESLSSSKGRRYIKNKLREKGVSENKINKVLETLPDEDNACEVALKKWLKGKNLPLDKKDKDKMYRHMLSKGFEFSTIKNALAVLGEGEEDYEDWD